MKPEMTPDGRVIPKRAAVVCGEHGSRAANERATWRNQHPPSMTRLPFESGKH